MLEWNIGAVTVRQVTHVSSALHAYTAEHVASSAQTSSELRSGQPPSGMSRHFGTSMKSSPHATPAASATTASDPTSAAGTRTPKVLI